MNLYNKYKHKFFYLNYFNNHKKYIYNEDIELILASGGLRGMYYCGVSYIVNKYINPKHIKSITGVSAGSLGAVVIACNIDQYKCRYYYDFLYKEYKKNKNSLIDCIINICNKLFPPNAYQICNDRHVRIILSEVSFLGLKKKVIDKFYSNRHLIDCIAASSYIPLLYNSGYPLTYKISDNYYIDGGFVDDIPYNINSKFKQLIINSSNLHYNLKYFITPSDENIDKIILLGVYDMFNFIKTKKNTENIYYYSIYINESRTYEIFLNKILKYIILFYLLNTILFMFNIKINKSIYKLFLFQKFIINIIILLIMILLLTLYKIKCYI